MLLKIIGFFRTSESKYLSSNFIIIIIIDNIIIQYIYIYFKKFEFRVP